MGESSETCKSRTASVSEFSSVSVHTDRITHMAYFI